MTREDMARGAQALAEEIRPLLAGQGPDVQGAALVDLVSLHLVSHFVPGDPIATRQIREDLLAAHVEAVRKLIPVNARIVGAEVSHEEN